MLSWQLMSPHICMIYRIGQTMRAVIRSSSLLLLEHMTLRLVDLNNTVRTIQAPPPPPGATTGASIPAIPAATLYDNAVRDKISGRPEMALKGFIDYVQTYGDTDRAPDAQFNIGQIHYEQSDFESAAKDFASRPPG